MRGLRLCYNIFLPFLFALYLPKLFWDYFFRGKYRKSLKERLGGVFPKTPPQGRIVIWIYAISVGETKSTIRLIELIRQQVPNSWITLSSVTETGFETAEQLIPDVDDHIYLPFDFTWTMKKLSKIIRPNFLLLIEGDFWLNMLYHTKKTGARVVLVSGKVSERSQRSYQRFPFFSRPLFSLIDLFCVQNDEYRNRFLSMNIPSSQIIVTGNAKFDAPLSNPLTDELKKALKISPDAFVITLGSTHHGEESSLLKNLELLWRNNVCKILIAPRHPHRFAEVEELLKSQKIPFGTYSQKESLKGNETIILIDTLGQLMACYSLSKLAIIGGSYVPIGGHNIFEPLEFGVPVLFGPHMHKQKELATFVLDSGSGLQISLAQVYTAVTDLIHDSLKREKMGLSGKNLIQYHQGATERTLKSIFFQKT